ncbi:MULTISPECIES: hypothetical protein [Chitinophagaceae]
MKQMTQRYLRELERGTAPADNGIEKFKTKPSEETTPEKGKNKIKKRGKAHKR